MGWDRNCGYVVGELKLRKINTRFFDGTKKKMQKKTQVSDTHTAK